MSISMLKKISAMLDKKQKMKVFFLLIMILIGGLLETAGVSLVLPLISAILDEKNFAANEYVIYFSNLFHIPDTRTFILLLLFGLMAMFIIKNAYLLLLTYTQSRFVNKNRCKSTRNLLSEYLHRPYEYYLYADTATILRTIYGDMDNVFNLLMQWMNLMAELVVSICLGIFLLLIDVKMMMIIVGLLLIVTVFISKVIKKRLNVIGEASRNAQGSLYKWILQSVTGIKDVKVLNK